MKNLTHLIIVYSSAFAKKIILSALLIFAVIFSQAQLHADFTETPSAGCAPLVINFNDISTGNPSTWRWDLGNGTTSFLQNPSSTYFYPGQYSVKLVVVNSLGSDSIVKNQIINVYAPSQVNFSGTPQTGCFPMPAQFTDLSVPVNGTITGWEWDFGDGIASAVQNPQHTYINAGNYNVSLRITNSYGCVSSITLPQYIQLIGKPKAGFTNTAPATCTLPTDIQFSNSSTGTGALSYQWDFGDGGTSTLANPTHTYNLAGNYTIRLITFNSNGCSDTLIKPNVVRIGNLKADFSVPAIVCTGDNVNFSNTTNPVPSASTWNFGDGTTSNSINPVKVFASSGNFNVQMVASFGTCKDSVIKPVQVVNKPIVDFTASPTFSCSAPATVNFTNISSGGNTYSWDFGDGTSSTQTNPSHTYLQEGFYSVILSVTNASGCTTTVVKKDFIKIKSPVVSINGLPQKGCGPLTHTFTANVNSIDPVVSYVWDFGDGTTSSLLSPTHTYTLPGAYTVSLYYTTSSGCTDTAKVINGILVGAKPVVNFSANPLDVCAETNVVFSDNSTGNPNEWLWFFGDGATSGTKNPNHQYIDSGYFSVTLIAINNGCADTLVKPKYIHVKPPIARFKSATTCSLPGHFVFTDMSIGADTWYWDFGDGTTSTIQNPAHDYSISGVYTVQLTVTNNTTGCSYTKTDTVTVIKEIADFNSSGIAVCKNTPVVFNAINSSPGNISSYTWRFGDGKTVSSTSNSTSHNYTGSGSFNVTMILNIKNGCIDSIVKPLAIKVDGPTAIFRTSNPGTCLNTAITFVDSSYPNGTSAINQWQWNWGDGITQILNGPAFQHTYSTPGNYSVSLKVTDNNGCTDSIMHLKTVVISKPVAAFKGDTLSCSSHGIAFTNLSSGPGLTYFWNFGDGSNSTQTNPVHTYINEGIYSVSLSITDLYGCTDFISKTNYVRIANPKADFAVSDTAGNCPPLIVNFTNKATNYFSWVWDFGDGATSSSFNPSHFYSTPGTFNAILTIKGPGGCSDQKSVQIIVKGPIGSFKYGKISGCKPLQTDFSATTGKNTTFIWDFNDGTTIATPDSVVSHTFKSQGDYLPKMILVDNNGCKVPIMGVDSIKVYGVLASFINPGSVVCDSGKVAFTNTSTSNDIITNYFWTFGDNTTSVLPNPIHNYTVTGNYATRLFVTSQNGCKDSVTVPSYVNVVKAPKISIGGNTGACTPAQLTFTGLISVPDTSSLQWNWDFANGNVSTLQNPLSQTFANSGSYSVRAIAVNSSGCSDTAIKVVEAYPLPNLQPTSDTTLCKGSSIVLKANDAQTYSWTPALYLSCTNCASPVSRPDSAIKYFVTGKSNKGCVSTDSVFVDMKFPNTVKVSAPDTLCIGSSVQLSASGAEVYSWSPSTGLNNTNIASPVASPGTTIIYKVVGSDTKGCFTSTGYIPIMVYPIPTVTAGVDKTINVGKSFTIIPQISPDVTNVTWSPSTGIIARNYPGITVKPVQSTEYTVEVSNEAGCLARDRISIFVLCDNTNVFVPNTFSPNGDGINDVFYPRGSGVFTVKNLRIFDRWGEVVFEKANFNANDASSGWDGTYKGVKLSPAVFVYALEVVCANNQSLVFKGNVALIK